MLRFFSKIRQSLINSKGVRKYILYAIGEIALVMIGILLALQVNNWNEWKKERILEKEILKELKEDLNRNILLLTERLLVFQDRDSSARIILHVLENKLPYQDSLAYHLLNSRLGFGLAAELLSQEGYDYLKFRGKNIVTKLLLRDKIIELFEKEYSLLLFVERSFADQDSQITEFLRRLFYLDNGELIPYDFKELYGQREYYSILNELIDYRRVVRKIIKSCIEASQEAYILIEEELKK